MAKKKIEYVENIRVEDAGSEGKAVAHIDGKVVFIPYAVPGDVLDLELIKSRKKYYDGRIVKIREASENRIKPECSHFGVCGGCKWQNFRYETQLEYKRKQVLDNFQRIGKLTYKTIEDIIPSDPVFYYRNKLEFTFSNRRWFTKNEFAKRDEDAESVSRNALGFHIPKMFDRIVNIEHCYLQADPSNDIRNEVYRYALEKEFDFYDVRNESGFLRNMIVRTSLQEELMLILVFAYEDKEKREMILNHIKERFPDITSLMYIINTKKNDSLSDLQAHLYSGRDHILEKLSGDERDYIFKIGPLSFFQTNPWQAAKLYKIVKDYAGLKGGELVYDLYTGTGTIAIYLSEKAKKVIGIEYIEDAVNDAKENAALNKVENTDFFAGDMARILKPAFWEANGKADVVICDPPRAGMHDKVIQQLKQMKAKKIIYVSCNPATQARDLEILCDTYSIDKIQPVDMFPHTAHVENVVLLKLKESL